MDMQQPQVKPTEIVINKTLPLHMQKSNFEERFTSFKEELSLCHNQFDLCKIELLSCHNKIKKDHKQVKIINNGLKGFVEDQSRINIECKKKMTSFDSEQIRLDQLILMLAETVTSLQEKIEKLEQQDSIEKSESIPKIIITNPDDTEKNIKTKSNYQQYIDQLTAHKKETVEQLNAIKERIANLNELTTKQNTAIEENKKDLLSLAQTFSELVNIIKTDTNNIPANLPITKDTNNSELQTLKTTIEQQNQTISKIKNLAIVSSTISGLSLFIWLWYYTNK